MDEVKNLDTEVFKNKAFCWFMVAIAFLSFGYYAVLFNLEEWAAKRGFGTRDGHDNLGAPFPKDTIQTFWLLSILNSSSTIGRLLVAVCSDRYVPLPPLLNPHQHPSLFD